MLNQENKRSATVLLLLFLSAGVAAAAPEPWEETMKKAALVKEGLGRLNNPHYQYDIIGLGGTTLRVGHDGFTRRGAPRIFPGGHLMHVPYLAYEYWWDEGGHRFIPFILSGGYGENFEPGQIVTFRHYLDIRTGILTIDMDMRADLVWTGLFEKGKNSFHTRREMFVTPEGVWVIRVTDSSNAALPFQLRAKVNQNIRIYLNAGIYKKNHPKWKRTVVEKKNGSVIIADRPKTCTATLAIACEGSGLSIDHDKGEYGSSKSGKTLTYYIAPGSSYESEDAAEAAWKKADSARKLGYNVLRRKTARWWKNYNTQSTVRLPDPTLAKWYARSIYYHGVFFGNTDIPTGCNATSVESFAGAVCPEVDLPFSQFALVYTSHFSESGGIMSWLKRVLPKTEKYAREGLTLHDITVKYSGGARYSTLMGWDGTVTVPPTTGEGVNAQLNYGGANAAAMALAHIDFAMDGKYDEAAKRVLKGTTHVSLEDQKFREDLGGYLCRNQPSAPQQSGAVFGLHESIKRGIAKPDWKEKSGKILLPTMDFKGSKVIVAGPGAAPFDGYGDACWLQGLWWYGVLSPDDPLVHTTYDMINNSLTGKYVFNNSWMGVFAAKLGKGEDAYKWAMRMIQPGVTLFDDTCFGEVVFGAEDFKKTPEIGAHGALICNVVQMLVNPDDEKTISVFPAVPETWRSEGIAFKNLATRGGIVVSASCTLDRIRVTLQNRSRRRTTRKLRVRLSKDVKSLDRKPEGTHIKNGWAILDSVPFTPGEKVTFNFTYNKKMGLP